MLERITARAVDEAAGRPARPPIRSRRMDTTWIYFLGFNYGERIKIGQSRQRKGDRIKQHERLPTGEKLQVELLCEVRGKPADEKTVQRFFSKWSVEGSEEVFWPSAELVDYVRWLRDQYFVAVTETTEDEREELPVIDSTAWLPNETRRKAKPRGVQTEFIERADPFVLGNRDITGDDYYTSEEVIAAARRLMGDIDLDPASHVVANTVVQAKRFFNQAENGLLQEWSGRLWINPPFSQWKQWVPKIIGEWRSGRIEEMCVLSAMRTVTARYFEALLAESNGVCVMSGRRKFWGGVAGDAPDDGHCIFYFGNRKDDFRKQFWELGTVFFDSRRERN